MAARIADTWWVTRHNMRRISAEQQDMLFASRKPKHYKGSSNCAIGWIGIARPNPSSLKSSARIDPTSPVPVANQIRTYW
jgi:hypothetical protein